MDHLPVEIIGNILSRLGAARNVIVASATCRKWQEARRNHLHTLSFNSNDWPLYDHEFSASKLDILITQTILQTRGLQCLSIIMDDADEFSSAAVVSWLMYTRDTLRELHYDVTTPHINILEICGRKKLEALTLSNNTIMGVEPKFQKFICLKSLTLSYVCIDAWDLSLLLKACPRVEALTFVSLDIVTSDPQVTMELATNSLKYIYVEDISLDKFILEAANLEKLHLRDCSLEVFELIGGGMLKFLIIDDVSVIHLDIGENAENLVTVDVSNFTIVWAKLYRMISRSSKLKKLRLWGVVFDHDEEAGNMKTISSCFPLINHLSLSYELREAAIHGGLQGSFVLKNVIVLELGWTVISDLFSMWVLALIERCPCLEKLVIRGAVSDTTTDEECQILANFTSSIVRTAGTEQVYESLLWSLPDRLLT